MFAVMDTTLIRILPIVVVVARAVRPALGLVILIENPVAMEGMSATVYVRYAPKLSTTTNKPNNVVREILYAQAAVTRPSA